MEIQISTFPVKVNINIIIIKLGENSLELFNNWEAAFLPAALQCQANSLVPKSTELLGAHGAGRELWMCPHGQDHVRWVVWVPKLLFNSGLKKGGVNNSVFWHAGWIFVLCLKFRGKTRAGQRVSSGLGNAGCGELPPAWSPFWEGTAMEHSPAKGFDVDIISIFQRKQILPEHFQWALIMCWYWNVSTANHTFLISFCLCP